MILYFTGTGNSRYIAEKIAKETEDKIIEEKGVIFWEDVKEIKETITVTNYDLVKYIDKNNYKLYLQPFLIKKRK